MLHQNPYRLDLLHFPWLIQSVISAKIKCPGHSAKSALWLHFILFIFSCRHLKNILNMLNMFFFKTLLKVWCSLKTNELSGFLDNFLIIFKIKVLYLLFSKHARTNSNSKIYFKWLLSISYLFLWSSGTKIIALPHLKTLRYFRFAFTLLW